MADGKYCCVPKRPLEIYARLIKVQIHAIPSYGMQQE